MVTDHQSTLLGIMKCKNTHIVESPTEVSCWQWVGRGVLNLCISEAHILSLFFAQYLVNLVFPL